MSLKKRTSLIDLRIFEVLWDSRGVLVMRVKPNVKWEAYDAEDHITFVQSVEEYLKGPLLIEMEVEGLSTVSPEAKAVYRTFDFKKAYIAKALYAETSHHRALISFMMSLLNQSGYPTELFSESDKGIDWLHECAKGTDWFARIENMKVNGLIEALHKAPMHGMVSRLIQK
ncbi:MAG: hypothetical protein O2867_00350 [Bacteroidetes bacterium]|nr:hypothetical protein [Bacteroidota bacterium]